ncbi:MAG: hypothetical protein [Cressdnaviricota sp.]|nr:MAG: hypothetical protein [Cressdnaviricota sp.]
MAAKPSKESTPVYCRWQQKVTSKRLKKNTQQNTYVIKNKYYLRLPQLPWSHMRTLEEYGFTRQVEQAKPNTSNHTNSMTTCLTSK